MAAQVGALHLWNPTAEMPGALSHSSLHAAYEWPPHHLRKLQGSLGPQKWDWLDPRRTLPGALGENA